jgi:hypothetical protein
MGLRYSVALLADLPLTSLPPLPIFFDRTPPSKSRWCDPCDPEAIETKRFGMEESEAATKQPMERHLDQECF